jgi:hypothetical protein
MMRLAGLALRRTAPPWLLAGLVVLLVLAARAAADTEPLVAGLSDAGRRALARQNVWSLLALAAPLVWLNAARTGTAAANAWLAPQPAHPLALAAARLLGLVLAVAAATRATAVIGETAVPASASGWRRVRTEPGPARVLDDAAPRVRWTIPAVAPGELAWLAVTVAPGAGPATTARFRAHARGATHASAAPSGTASEVTVEARVAGRTRLALALPSGAPLALELERSAGGALLVLPRDALEIVAPLPSDRGAALALALHAFLLLAGAAALAAGLASILTPALATGVVLALALAACTGPVALARWVPGAELARTWRELARGLVPAAPHASAWAGALVLVVLGLALQGARQAEDA